jgi:hypothetical protein
VTADGLRRPEAARVDVVALGESKVTFLPAHPGRPADVPSFDRAVGGAESDPGGLRPGPGRTQADQGPEEVRTP